MTEQQIRHLLSTLVARDEFGIPINPGEDLDFTNLGDYEEYKQDCQQILKDKATPRSFTDAEMGMRLVRSLATARYGIAQAGLKCVGLR
jgi:hypothetical protein